MKKIVFALVMCACSMAANAQMWVGGSFGLDVSKQKEGDASVLFTLSPEFGYNITDKWAVAGALEIAASNAAGKPFVFAINPFARYSFARVGIANFFVDGGINFGLESTKVLNDRNCNGLVGFGVRPGVKLELNKHLALEAKTGYLGYRYRGSNETHTFGLGVNNEQLSFGLVYEF